MGKVPVSRCIVWLFFLAGIGSLRGESSHWDIALRLGPGQRVPGRLDGNLSQFSSTFNPQVPGVTQIESQGLGFLGEVAIFRTLDGNSKIGVMVGRVDQAPIRLTQFTGDLYAVQLKNDIFSYHVIPTYQWFGKLSKKWEWQTGLGIGATVTDWIWKGVGLDFGAVRNFNPQTGDLRGIGLAMRLEGMVQRQVSESVFLGVGLHYHFVSVPQFTGNANGATGSLYISDTGRVGILDNTRVTDASFQTNQFLRRLDLNSGSWNLTFSVTQRFLD